MPSYTEYCGSVTTIPRGRQGYCEAKKSRIAGLTRNLREIDLFEHEFGRSMASSNRFAARLHLHLKLFVRKLPIALVDRHYVESRLVRSKSTLLDALDNVRQVVVSTAGDTIL